MGNFHDSNQMIVHLKEMRTLERRTRNAMRAFWIVAFGFIMFHVFLHLLVRYV